MYSVNQAKLERVKLPQFDSYLKEAHLIPLPEAPVPYTSDTRFGQGRGFLHDDLKAFQHLVQKEPNATMIHKDQWKELFALDPMDMISETNAEDHVAIFSLVRSTAINLAFSKKSRLFSVECPNEEDPLPDTSLQDAAAYGAAIELLGPLHSALDFVPRDARRAGGTWAAGSAAQPSRVAQDTRSRYERGESDSDIESVAPLSEINGAKSAQQQYLASNQDKKVLLALCIGLSVGDYSSEPYTSARKKNLFKPETLHLSSEVKRRYLRNHKGNGKLKVPKCDNWGKKKLTDWLIDNPITNQDEVSFILERELEFRNAVQASNTEAPIASADGFYTLKSCLRLHHVLTDDRVRQLYARRNDLSDRLGTDARGSDSRPATWFEVAADLYNDSSYCPTSLALPYLHDDFADSMTLEKDFQRKVSPDEVKKKVADWKARTVIIISRWEASGNGAGQRLESDPEFGNTTFATQSQETYIEGDNRRSFIQGEPTHCLYLWNILESLGLLYNFREKIAETVAADANSVSSTTSSRKRRKGNDDHSTEDGDSVGTKEFRIGMMTAITNLANSQKAAVDSSSNPNIAQLASTLAQLNSTKIEFTKMWLEEKKALAAMECDPDEREAQQEIVDELRENVDGVKNDIDAIKKVMESASATNAATPVRRNRASSQAPTSSIRYSGDGQRGRDTPVSVLTNETTEFGSAHSAADSMTN